VSSSSTSKRVAAQEDSIDSRQHRQ
jgi:hypothetical protein